jgi:nucleotide-binding universal stress UspA family protein
MSRIPRDRSAVFISKGGPGLLKGLSKQKETRVACRVRSDTAVYVDETGTKPPQPAGSIVDIEGVQPRIEDSRPDGGFEPSGCDRLTVNRRKGFVAVPTNSWCVVTMYNRILVPTDGSAGMTAVIDHASELAEAHDAEIHFLYVVNTASFANLPMETSWDNVTSMLREEGEAALRAAEDRATVDRVVTSISEGPPSREIVEYARRERCDLVVMGTHGRGGLNRLLLGSVAERVVRSSEVPVLTVRVGTTREASPEESTNDRPVSADPSVSEVLE